MIEILLTAVVLVVFAAVIYGMERRVKARGALFSGRPTPLMRVLAIVFGILFLGLFASELTTTSEIHLLFPVLAILLLSYGLGAGQLLVRLQRGSQPDEAVPASMASRMPGEDSQPQSPLDLPLRNRLLLFSVRVVIVLGISALALYGAVWAVTHPGDPLALAYIVGVIVLVVLASISPWVKFLRDLFK